MRLIGKLVAFICHPKPSCKICFGHLKFDEEINISLSDIKCNLAWFFIDKQNLNPCSVVQCCCNNRIWAISGSAIMFCFATSCFAMLCCAMLGSAMLRYACYALLCYAMISNHMCCHYVVRCYICYATPSYVMLCHAGFAGWLGWLAGLAGWLAGLAGWLAGWLAVWLR